MKAVNLVPLDGSAGYFAKAEPVERLLKMFLWGALKCSAELLRIVIVYKNSAELAECEDAGRDRADFIDECRMYVNAGGIASEYPQPPAHLTGDVVSLLRDWAGIPNDAAYPVSGLFTVEFGACGFRYPWNCQISVHLCKSENSETIECRFAECEIDLLSPPIGKRELENRSSKLLALRRWARTLLADEDQSEEEYDSDGTDRDLRDALLKTCAFGSRSIELRFVRETSQPYIDGLSTEARFNGFILGDKDKETTEELCCGVPHTTPAGYLVSPDKLARMIDLLKRWARLDTSARSTQTGSFLIRVPESEQTHSSLQSKLMRVRIQTQLVETDGLQRETATLELNEVQARALAPIWSAVAV